MRSAREKDLDVIKSIKRRTGIELSMDNARTIRRISLTLHRWAELECGDGRCWIERDESTGKPYLYVDGHYIDPKPRRYSTADRERGALRRISELCKRAGLHFYHQTDPRGCALYIAAEPMTDQDYSSKGAAIC